MGGIIITPLLLWDKGEGEIKLDKLIEWERGDRKVVV